MAEVQKKQFKIFMGGDLAVLEDQQEQFLSEGRKKVEIRYYSAMDKKQINAVNIPGFQLPPGAVQVSYEMMFFHVLVYLPSKKDQQAIQDSPGQLKINN